MKFTKKLDGFKNVNFDIIYQLSIPKTSTQSIIGDKWKQCDHSFNVEFAYRGPHKDTGRQHEGYGNKLKSYPYYPLAKYPIKENIKVAYIPKRYSSVGIGEVFTKLNAVGKKVIVPRSGASTPFLKDLLEKIGLNITELHLYDVCAFRDTSQWNVFRKLFSQNKVDGIIFTSASSVRAFVEIMTKDYEQTELVGVLHKISIIAIGPFTADELKKLNVENVIADVHTVSGAFDAVRKAFSLAEAI